MSLKNNFTKIFTVTTLGISALGFSGISNVPTFAIGSSSSSLTARQETRKTINEARCTIAESRIAARITAYENRQAKDVGDFTQIRNKVSEAITKLKDKGANTTALEASLATMDSQIATLKADHTKLIENLKTTQSYACGESEGQFKDALNTARNQQKVVEADRVLVRNTLKTIRTQLTEAVNSIK